MGNFSNFGTSSTELTVNASEILQHLIDKRLKLNCANFSAYYDSETPTDLEKLLNISVESSEVNHDGEEYHHRMKRCSELERQNRIIQEFATRQQRDKAHPVKKPAKNLDNLILGKHSDVNEGEIRGDMVHSVHRTPSTSIFSTTVTESLPRGSTEIDAEDGKMLAEAVLQRFNVNRDESAFESDHGIIDVPNHVKDAHSFKRTDRSSPKPPSLLQKIRDIMEGGSLKDAVDADSPSTPGIEHSSTYKITRLEYGTSQDTSDPSRPPKNIFQYVTDAVNRGYHAKNDSGTNLSKSKSRTNSPSMGTLHQRNFKDDSLQPKIEELANLHKLLSELLRSHNAQKNQANGNSTEYVRSTHHQSDPKPRINPGKASIYQKIHHTKDSPPSTPSFSPTEENFEKMANSNGDGERSPLAGQTSLENDPIRKLISTSTEAAKSTSLFSKHLPTSVTTESRISTQQFSTADVYLHHLSTKHHTPKPDLPSNQSSHLESHLISKGQKSKVEDEPQSKSDPRKPPSLRTEMEKTTSTPKIVLTNNNEQTTENLRSTRSTLVALHYPTLTTIARSRFEEVPRQSSAFSSTFQNTQLNEGKHHFTDTTPLLPLSTTVSLKNGISIPETTHSGDTTATFSPQSRSATNDDILMTEHRDVPSIEPHLESLHHRVSSLPTSATPQKPHITPFHHQQITTPTHAPLSHMTHPSPSNLHVPSTYTTYPQDEDSKTILEDIMRLEKEKRQELINIHKSHLKHLQKEKEHAAPTQVPFSGQKISHTTTLNPPTPATQVTTSQNEDIASILKEIMELEKEKRDEVMNLHKTHLKILLRDKESTHVTQAPLVHEKVTHLSSTSDLYIPTTQAMSPQNDDITSMLKEIMELEKERREELMHLHRNHFKTLVRDSENMPVTREPFLEPKIAHYVSSNLYLPSTQATTSQNEDIKTIIEDISRLEKEKREELINLHKSHLKRFQKDKENASFLDKKITHTTPPNSQTTTAYFTTPHNDDIKTTLETIMRSEKEGREGLINLHKNYLKGSQKDKENTTPSMALLWDQKITPSVSSSSHIAPTHVTTPQNEDIKTILEDIMKLEKERREELINLHKNHLKSLQSNKESTTATQVSIFDQKMTNTTPLNPHVPITHVVPSQNDEITSILEEITKLEKEKREELMNLHKKYLKDKADKPLPKVSLDLEHSSKHNNLRDHVLDSSTTPVSKLTPLPNKLDHQRAPLHSHDRSANPRKNEISHVHDTANSRSTDSLSTPFRISNGLKKDHNLVEGEENVQKPHLPHPPLNPNENWKFVSKLDEFYEKQKSQTTPTPRRTRPITAIPSHTTRPTTEVPPSSTATPKITIKMRPTTEYTPVPRNSSRSTNRPFTTTQATPTTTTKSKEKGYTVNSTRTITRNYNITINLAPPEIPKSPDKDDDSSESYDDSAPSPYPPYPAPVDSRAQSFNDPDELTGMSSQTPKSSDAPPSVTAGEYTAMPYTPYPSPIGFGVPLPPLPPMQYSGPPYLAYPPSMPGMIPPPNQFSVPSYPPYPPPMPPLVEARAPLEGASQFSGSIPMPPSEFGTNEEEPQKPFIFENNDAILQSPRPHFPILKVPEVVTASSHHERPNNQESKNLNAHAYLYFDKENLATQSPRTDIDANKLNNTAILAQSSCSGENCTKKECNNVYVIPDLSADVMQILRLLNVVKPLENATESIQRPMLLSSNPELSSIADNSEILGSRFSNSMSNIKNMLSSVQGSISTGSDTAELRQSINELLALLKERRNQEYTNLYATRLNPNNSYGKNNVVTIMQINEYIELLELMLVYLARDPDKLLDEGKDARISNDESPYPRNDPHRRLIEDQFYYVHPKILNEFIDVYKKYSRDDGYFGKPIWRYPQENGPRSASRSDVIGKSLNKLFHLQGLLPELMYNRAAMYRPGVDYVE